METSPKTLLLFGVEFRMTKGFVTQENSPEGKGFHYPLLTAHFSLHGEEENVALLFWEPVWSNSLEHLRSQSSNSPCIFCGFQPVCFGTGVTEIDI